jgi:hypothetical protein
MDLAVAKLTFDRIVDPSVRVGANLEKIQRMTAEIRALAGQGAKPRDLVSALRRYLYDPGAWNGGKPFQYDLTDPLGRRLPTRLLSYYLAHWHWHRGISL